MKLKCDDGKTRNFRIACECSTAKGLEEINNIYEAACKECGELFGNSDTRVLKPRFRAHVCPTTVLKLTTTEMVRIKTDPDLFW